MPDESHLDAPDWDEHVCDDCGEPVDANSVRNGLCWYCQAGAL